MEKRIGVGWMLVINANGRDRQEGHRRKKEEEKKKGESAVR